MIYSDFHTHSSYSPDSDVSISSLVKTAIQKGLRHICITDHQDFDKQNIRLFDTDSYIKELANVKHQYREYIEVLTGVEIGLLSANADKAKAYISQYPFDFIIGSTHLLSEKDLSPAKYSAVSSGKSGVEEHLKAAIDNIRAVSDFQVYGHIDYIVRYITDPAFIYDCNDYKDLIDEVLRLLIQKGIGIDVNSSGLRMNLGFAHPHPFILKRYRELGGEIITVGSDAHNTKDIAADFALVEATLKDAGFLYYTIFKEKKPIFKPL